MTVQQTSLHGTSLGQTIITDLKAGVSWFEHEAADVALEVWNLLKGAFIALGHEAMADLLAILKDGLASAKAGMSVEELESHILNGATAAGKDLLKQAGSSVVQQLLIGLTAAI